MLWLAVGFLVLYLAMTWTRPLAHPDEGRYVEIPREMVATGDWITPRLNGVLYFYKPPLFYWAEAVAYSVGGTNLFALRFFPAFMSVLGILGTYAFARYQYGRLTGLCSAGVLGTCLLYFGLGQIILLDMMVSAFMALSLFLFYTGLHEEKEHTRRWLFWLFYACVALAVLSKGLMALLVPGAVIFCWFLIFNQWHKLKNLYLISGSLIFLIIALPWHVAVHLRNPEWFNFYIIHEHFLRYLSDVSDRAEPFWYFFVVMPAGLFPWLLFLPQAVLHGFRGAWKRRGERLCLWYLAIWVLFILFFFSLSSSKLIPYILPAYPALAIIVGRFIAQAWSQPERFKLGWSLIVFAVLAALGAIALPVAVIARAHKVNDGVMLPVVITSLILAAISVCFVKIYRGKNVRQGIAAMFVAIVAFLFMFNPLAAGFQRTSAKPVADFLNQTLAPDDQIYTFQDYYQDLPVYLKRTVGIVYNMPKEQAFGIEWEPEQASRYLDQEAIAAKWGEPGRIFGIAKDDHYKQFKVVAGEITDQPVFFWYGYGPFVVFSNQPMPEELRVDGDEN